MQGPQKEKKGPEKIFKEILAEDLPNMGKKIIHQVQDARCPRQINPRRNTLRHIVIKMMKIKDKDKILKATGKNDNIQENPHKIIS